MIALLDRGMVRIVYVNLYLLKIIYRSFSDPVYVIVTVVGIRSIRYKVVPNLEDEFTSLL